MIIKTEKLTKYYGKTPGIRNLDLEVKKGEIFGFLGPNGAGKTTTIRCLMDFLKPTSGKIKILGLDSHDDSVELKNKIGYLSAENTLYENLSGQAHIDLIAGIRTDGNTAKKLARRLNFDPLVRVKNLSSGNRQKLDLILTLMTQPELLILDEPTQGLDPLLQNTIYEILKEEQQKGTTIFMSSHNLHEVENICDRVAIIRDNKLVTTENIQQLKLKKLYTISVFFDQKINKSQLNLKGAKILGDLPNGGIKLSVKHDLNPVIKEISKYKIKDLEIERAHIEEIFLEFYKKKK